MTYIPQHFHFNFLSLKLLNMSHNLLGSNNPRLIPTDDLNFLQNNGLTVDLAFNQIENVELWNERSSLSENQWRGFSLNLAGNPIKCNCWTTELKLKVTIFHAHFNVITIIVVITMTINGLKS